MDPEWLELFVAKARNLRAACRRQNQALNGFNDQDAAILGPDIAQLNAEIINLRNEIWDNEPPENQYNYENLFGQVNENPEVAVEADDEGNHEIDGAAIDHEEAAEIVEDHINVDIDLNDLNELDDGALEQEEIDVGIDAPKEVSDDEDEA